MKKSLPFLAPSALGTLVLYAIPFCIMLLYALSVGATASLTILQNPTFITCTINTAIFIMVGLSVSLFLGLTIALTLDFHGLFIRFLLICPLLIPSATIAVIWRNIFAFDGWANRFLSWLGLSAVDWFKSSAGLIVLILLLIWKILGITIVLIDAALQKIPREILESAQLDGTPPLQMLFHIKWPYLASSLFFAGLIDLFFAWRTFREIYLITGDYPFDRIYLLQHYLLHMFRALKYPSLAYASLLLTVVIIVSVGLLLGLVNRRGRDVDG